MKLNTGKVLNGVVFVILGIGLNWALSFPQLSQIIPSAQTGTNYAMAQGASGALYFLSPFFIITAIPLLFVFGGLGVILNEILHAIGFWENIPLPENMK